MSLKPRSTSTSNYLQIHKRDNRPKLESSTLRSVNHDVPKYLVLSFMCFSECVFNKRIKHSKAAGNGSSRLITEISNLKLFASCFEYVVIDR